MAMIWIILQFAIMTGFWASSAEEKHCETAAIERSWRACEQTYFTRDDAKTKLAPFEACADLECYLQCIEDAVGECSTSDTFLNRFADFDFKKIRVLYRYVCFDTNMSSLILHEDSPCTVNDSCVERISSNADALRDMYMTGRYDDYRNTLCSALKTARSCITVSMSDNCSTEAANFLKNVQHIRMSYSTCENADIKDYYANFGGDTRCNHPKINSKCLYSRLVRETAKCPTIQLQADDPKLETNVANICKSVECNLKCLEDTIQDCYLQDENLLFDPVVVKVSSRAICAKQSVIVSAVQRCKTMTTECRTNYSLAAAEAKFYLEEQNDYTLFRTTLCSANNALRECMDYTVDEDCTAELVSALKDVYTVKLSYSQCGPQTNSLFSKFGYETKCHTSGTVASWRNHHLVTALFLLTFIVFYVGL